ncbi:MAG: PEGA domain-containing protein [Candidatus Sungbacteria bacterium]|nr:PEGA domain-containing protein [Candidatus Sungbacteria bacterium]
MGARGATSMVISKTKRRIFFYISIAMFLLITPLILLYSKGYAISLKNRDIIKTGSIFLKSSNEAGLKVYLDGTFYRETSFLSRGALVSDLKPGNHALRIEKEGFAVWQKTLPVAPERVTEVRNIFLLPDLSKSPASVFIHSASSSLSIISLSPDESKIAVREKTKGTVGIVDAGSGATEETDIHSGKNILGAAWADDSTRLLLQEPGDKLFIKNLALQKQKSVSELPATIRRENADATPNTYDTASAAFDPSDTSGIFIFDTAGVLSKLPLKISATSTAVSVLENINSYGISKDSILVLFKNGFFGKTDLAGKKVVTLGRKGAFISETAMAQMGESDSGDIYFIDASNGLFLSQKGDIEIEPIDGGVLGAAFSEDGKKLLYWKESELAVVLLDDEQYQPFRKNGTRIKIPAPGERIQKAAWYEKDAEHIIVLTQNGLFVSDIDDRGGFFIKKLIERPIENFFYSAKNQKLYWGDGSSIYSLPF